MSVKTRLPPLRTGVWRSTKQNKAFNPGISKEIIKLGISARDLGWVPRHSLSVGRYYSLVFS